MTCRGRIGGCRSDRRNHSGAYDQADHGCQLECRKLAVRRLNNERLYASYTEVAVCNLGVRYYPVIENSGEIRRDIRKGTQRRLTDVGRY